MEARLNYYYGLVYPNLIYNVIPWGRANPTHFSPLIAQYKRTIRTFLGPTIWNQLPINVRNIESSLSFKRALKSHFISPC